ncbi:MAG: MotA/TolQ/ExbB proton channel family protein [Burkholderiales bacterium]|nr:MotA/TolQ/ExbB proton channel family protein [Burkholderiales bacterium]
MLAIIEAAGWPIWPILLASVIAVTFIIYCLFNLRKSAVAPKELLPRVVQEYRQGGVNRQMLAKLSANSPLGRIFAAGLKNVSSTREVMKESIEEAGRAAAHDLERFVPAIGTIASMGPLLGLLGTEIGMIEIFGSQAPTGSSPAQLAHGISIALYNTAFGLIVAIPSMFFYRYFRSKIDSLVIDMEMQAIKLVEIVHGERQA